MYRNIKLCLSDVPLVARLLAAWSVVSISFSNLHLRVCCATDDATFASLCWLGPLFLDASHTDAGSTPEPCHLCTLISQAQRQQGRD